MWSILSTYLVYFGFGRILAEGGVKGELNSYLALKFKFFGL
jgi:hypothetical protein